MHGEKRRLSIKQRRALPPCVRGVLHLRQSSLEKPRRGTVIPSLEIRSDQTIDTHQQSFVFRRSYVFPQMNSPPIETLRLAVIALLLRDKCEGVNGSGEAWVGGGKAFRQMDRLFKGARS